MASCPLLLWGDNSRVARLTFNWRRPLRIIMHCHKTGTSAPMLITLCLVSPACLVLKVTWTCSAKRWSRGKSIDRELIRFPPLLVSTSAFTNTSCFSLLVKPLNGSYFISNRFWKIGASLLQQSQDGVDCRLFPQEFRALRSSKYSIHLHGQWASFSSSSGSMALMNSTDPIPALFWALRARLSECHNFSFPSIEIIFDPRLHSLSSSSESSQLLADTCTAMISFSRTWIDPRQCAARLAASM